MKKLSLIIVVILTFLPLTGISLEVGKWNFVKDEDWCYIGSTVHSFYIINEILIASRKGNFFPSSISK